MVSNFHFKGKQVRDEDTFDCWMNNLWQRYRERMISRRFKYCSVILFFLAVSSWVSAQVATHTRQLSTDQLLQHFRSLKDPSQQRLHSDDLHDGKCGFGIRAQVHSQWNAFSALQKIELKQLIAVDSMQKEKVIGRFKILYDTAGINMPALLDVNNQPLPNTAEAYVDSVGAIFNYVYSIEVDALGYQAPPHEQGESYYRIYIQDQGVDGYGLTDWDPDAPNLKPSGDPPRYACFVEVDNDFKDQYTKGINALKVTAAHEFHHVVQVGSYGFWGNDTYVHELTSVWMEDVVYTYVNDYYQYLPDYFVRFSYGLSFNSDGDGGYERCIFAHCIAKIYGTDIMKDIWTQMRTLPFLESADDVLVNRGSNLQSTFAVFTKWNYYTADRADTVNFYPEGNHYPRFQPLQKTAFYNAVSTLSGNVYPLSSSMYEFDTQQDTITAIIANVDVGNAINRSTTQQKIDVTLSSGLQFKISVDTLSLWGSYFIQSSTHTDVHRRLDAVPNPFRLAESPWLKLSINQDNANSATVFFFTSSFKLAYSGMLNVDNESGFRAIVVPTSEVKSKLSSGIYFIMAKTANSDYKWKVAVIR